MGISFKEARERKMHGVCHKCGIDRRFKRKRDARKFEQWHAKEVHGKTVARPRKKPKEDKGLRLLGEAAPLPLENFRKSLRD